MLDFKYVLEYLWNATLCFFDKGDEAVEACISQYVIKLLKRGCSQVAKGLRQSATKRKLTKRDAVDICAKYWDFHKQQSKKRLYTIKSLSSA